MPIRARSRRMNTTQPPLSVHTMKRMILAWGPSQVRKVRAKQSALADCPLGPGENLECVAC